MAVSLRPSACCMAWTLTPGWEFFVTQTPDMTSRSKPHEMRGLRKKTGFPAPMLRPGVEDDPRAYSFGCGGRHLGRFGARVRRRRLGVAWRAHGRDGHARGHPCPLLRR